MSKVPPSLLYIQMAVLGIIFQCTNNLPRKKDSTFSIVHALLKWYLYLQSLQKQTLPSLAVRHPPIDAHTHTHPHYCVVKARLPKNWGGHSVGWFNLKKHGECIWPSMLIQFMYINNMASNTEQSFSILYTE